jgi:hypothetical protein
MDEAATDTKVLKPCPRNKGAHFAPPRVIHSVKRGKYAVDCFGSECMPRLLWRASKAEAIAAWNRRA